MLGFTSCSRTLTRLVVCAGAAAVLGTGAAACGSDDDAAESDATAGGAASLERVTFRTGIQVGPWDAGWVVARERGFYREAGLDVSIDGGLGSASNVQLVATNKSTFVHADGSNTAIARSKGADIKMVASFVQTSGSGLAAEPSIKTPADMAGKTVGGPVYDYTTRLIGAFEAAAGTSDIKSRTVEPGALPQILIQGRVDMMPALGWAEVPELEVDGFEFTYFPFSDYGLNLLGPGIVTNSKTLEEKPDVVKRFAEASARGWQYVFDNPEEAAVVLHEAYPDVRQDYAEAIAKVQANFAHTPATEGKTLGWLSPEDWESTVSILVDNKILEKPIDSAMAFHNVLEEG